MVNDERFELAAVIDALRLELMAASVAGDGHDLRFVADRLDIETSVEIEKSATGKAGLKFWVVNAEAGGTVAQTTTTKVTVSLRPTSDTTGQFKISGSRLSGED
ncbi:trypco2 family protein [Gordonia polyisoprenivorans]|uniref:trypco2 family protein n=1 Tax=Gordonia polyisoprenivorans TaxID=84595 RepID=UPI002301D379|nr:trypco2 family protein [Gordonia polyisoprenivorans]WCB39478.1 hypothetical protein PHA63_10400 [Gordonia polyisoprenivorans]